MDQLDGEKGAGRAVERMRRRAQTNGKKDICLGIFTWSAAQAALAKTLGFDRATTYKVTGGPNQARAQALVDYRDVMAKHVETWRAIGDVEGMPYWPVVTRGWDVTARNHPYEAWPPVRWGWPWGHVVVGNTPERFGELVHAARQFMAGQKQEERVMVINAWNEWTEGSVMLPTKDEGYGALKALKRALR